jgi:lauroyl/myristoyl acyltransferase
MFHRTALLPRGPAFFALKTGAQVIAAFLLREKKKFYHLIFEEPVFISQEAIKTEEEIVFRYADILSRYLKRYPGQWYMFEKYWLSEEVGSKIVYQNIRLSVGRISDQDIR